MVQYTILHLIPDIDQRVSDLCYENYNIPEMQHGHRRLQLKDRAVAAGAVLQYTEADYVDARQAQQFSVPDVEMRSTLSQADAKKLQGIIAALQDLLRCKTVRPAVMQRLLDAEQHLEYQRSLDAPSDSAEITYGDGEPDELRGYKQRVAAADFQFAKAEKMAARSRMGVAKSNSEKITKAYHRAEHLYELALERLEEIWSCASDHERWELQNWMDREIDFDAGTDSNMGIDCDQIPRVRGSRSAYGLDTGLPKLNRRLKQQECQLKALRSAAWRIAFDSDEDDDAQPSSGDGELLAKLRAKLSTRPAAPADGKTKLQRLLSAIDPDAD